MVYTKKQVETFEAYRAELLNIDSIKDYIASNICGRIWCETPESLTDGQKLELSGLATECLREWRRISRAKNWYKYA